MDVWKIGVAISMSNGVSPVLAVIAADLLGLKGKVGEVEKAFSGWNLALNGTAAILAGAAILGAMGRLVEHGKELVHVQEQLGAAGVKQVEVAEATAEAWKVASQYGLKVSDVLADIKEARMVFGSTEHAMDFIEPLERMRVVLNSVSEGSGNKASDAVYQMARAGELKGLQNPGDFISYFDQMTRAVTASGGKVSPDAFLQATQYGRLASKGWGEEFYTRILPSMIQEMGPSQTGTALMSLFGTTVQGKVSKRSLGMMDDIGLIADPSKITYNKLGDPMGMAPGAIAGSDLMIKNPYQWAQEILRPLVEKKLGREVKPGDEGAIELLGGMFGNRTSAQAIATMLLESGRINKDASLIGQSKGLNAADDLLAKDPTAVMNNFKNSWDNLLTALGSPMVSLATDAMNGLARAFKYMTEFAVANPTAVKLIGEAIIGIGAALVALGATAVVAAAVSVIGPVGAAVAAIAGAITAIAALNWDAAQSVLNSIVSGLTFFINQIKATLGDLKSIFSWGMPGSNPNVTPGNRAPGAGQQQWQAPGPGGRGTYSPTNWAPPANGNQPVQIHTALNVDGRRLANAVSTHVAKNGAWSSSSSSFDGRSMPSPTDVNYI